MKLNQDFTMAVETVQFLQKTKSNDYIRAEEIAGKLGFSVGYLQKVIQALCKAGIIESKRGTAGGVRLRKRKITLLDMWNSMCGPIDLVDPGVPEARKALRVFSDAMSKAVICK